MNTQKKLNQNTVYTAAPQAGKKITAGTIITLAIIAAVVITACVLTHENGAVNTYWALLAPVAAIALALVTKEVYSSLFIGVLIGALLFAKCSFTGTLDAIINDGLISAVSDNAGIFIFLILLGIIVCLVNKTGGSQAFGRWAEKHIKTKVGASLATFAIGVLIFIDDYFNCLTVGSVMRPVTDSQKMSRAKLAYLIDATAAPICMIAPISSWAAAVSGCVEGDSFNLFVKAIPYNFYSLLTIIFIIVISVMGFDYGKMSGFEIKAQNGDLGGIETKAELEDDKDYNRKGRVIDLLLPIVILIVACLVALVYVGGFFSAESEFYHDFIGAFGETDAFVALPWGALISLVVIIIYLVCRGLISVKESMEAVPKGFIAMVPAILILTLATSLKNMTNLLEARTFVGELTAGFSEGLTLLLPAVIFLIACLLSFSTGTSWGTFGILIPIVTSIFRPEDGSLLFIGISACLAGAVCGDHCSPISDTTIMASAGARVNHVDHVSSQIPYAVTVAVISLIGFIIAPFIDNWFITFPIITAITVGFLFFMKWRKKSAK